MSNFEKYKELLEEWLKTRDNNTVEKNDEYLDELDRLWWSLTDAEMEELNNYLKEEKK